MKRLARYVLAAMFAGTTVLHGIPASAQDYDEDDYRESAPDPDDYQDALTPYGEWVDQAEYGRVWHPRVAVGWRPYYDGRWVWSPYGWTWVSSEPWAWTFHYGRWSYAPVWGWVWVPGTVWGPAWVDWYWDDGYVGWAPLSPFASHVTVVNQFIFVRDRDFCSPRIHHLVIDHRRLPRRVSDHWRHRDFGRGFRAPDRDRIQRVSSHPVPRVDDKPPQTVAPKRFRDGDRLARPRKSPGKEPDLGQARRGGWQRGDRRADDAPDASQRAGRGREARPRPDRERDDVGVRPRAGRNPDVSRREPRLSPPDPAPKFDAPDARRGGRSSGGARQRAETAETHRRQAPAAIPGGSMMAPQSGGQPRARGTEGSARGAGGQTGRGDRGHVGGGERSAHGDSGGRGDRGGRGTGGGRGDAGGPGGGFQSGWR